jgi:coproporphyrinogen III oxidase-like Fe-S oxidoreductase
MTQSAKVDPQALVEQMRAAHERTMRQVMKAVNDAPDGQWIEGSEDQVADLMTDLQRQTFQTALQMRADAAEASFSPSEE